MFRIDQETFKTFGTGVTAGEIIYHQGEVAQKMYGVYSGEVRLFRSVGSKPFTLRILNAHQFFGELELLCHLPRLSAAQALVDSELIVIDRLFFESYLLAHPKVTYQLLRASALQQEQLYRQLENFLVGDSTFSAINALVGILRALPLEKDVIQIPYGFDHLVELVAGQTQGEKRIVEQAFDFLRRSELLIPEGNCVTVPRPKEIESYLAYLSQRLQYTSETSSY